MKKNRKHLLITLCLMLVVCVVSVGGTLAWLTDNTTPVVNTFSPSNIDVELKETGTELENGVATKDFQIVPGVDIVKDPKVTASSNVAYYVFVKVKEENWPTVKDGTTNKVSYEIDGYWTKLEVTGLAAGEKLYYKELGANTIVGTKNSDDTITGQNVLKDNKVVVSNTLTKEELAAMNPAPKLTFTAYAIQKEGFANATAAWAEVSK